MSRFVGPPRKTTSLLAQQATDGAVTLHPYLTGASGAFPCWTSTRPATARKYLATSCVPCPATSPTRLCWLPRYWGGRIRTFEYRYQKPGTYHLSTPQHRWSNRRMGWSRCLLTCLSRIRVLRLPGLRDQFGPSRRFITTNPRRSSTSRADSTHPRGCY